jgi:20S proteasome alpha/beta subunit
VLNFGTTLIAVAIPDGIVMAADDLMYSEQGGEPSPLRNGVHKVFAVGQNILIGSAGLLSHSGIEYQIENWMAEFVDAHDDASTKRPSDIAAALETKMRDTFHAARSQARRRDLEDAPPKGPHRKLPRRRW